MEVAMSYLDVLTEDQRGFFEKLLAYAQQGIPCPTNAFLKDTYGMKEIDIVKLRKAGLIAVILYTGNQRVIRIEKGPHKGEKTKTPPTGRPYKVLEHDPEGDKNARRTPSALELPDFITKTLTKK